MPVTITQESLAVQKRRLETERPPREWMRELEALRPKTRGDCVANGLRPCPFSCRHNLTLEAYPTGRLRVLAGATQSCALDVADANLGDGLSLEAIGNLMGISRERVNQIAGPAKEEIRSVLTREQEEDIDEQETYR